MIINLISIYLISKEWFFHYSTSKTNSGTFSNMDCYEYGVIWAI